MSRIFHFTLLHVLVSFSLLLYRPFASAAPEVTHHEDGRVTIALTSNGTHQHERRLVELLGWDGCGSGSGSQKQQILDSWGSMLEMGELVKGKIQFDTKVARDYLGSPLYNEPHQNSIRKILENVVTWKLGGSLSWHLSIYCNDYLRRGVIKCPPGTADGDRYKCGSRCWKYDKASNGNIVWSYNARAYTTSYKNSDTVGYTNYCPGWFAMPTCANALARWSGSRGSDKWHMQNYLCRESAMVHELFHLDAMSAYVSPETGHVYDRKITMYKYGNSGDLITIKAYGPTWAKCLANWTKDVGKYVATNADSLALYWLGRWIQLKAGFYPDSPWTARRPVSAPTPKLRHRLLRTRQDPNMYDPFAVNGTKVALNDRNDLAIALLVPVADVDTVYAPSTDGLDCLDIQGASANDTNPACYSASVNPALTLDGTLTPIDDNNSTDPSTGDVGQQIAFASYINPIGDPNAWSRLVNYDNRKLTVLVANVLNGPDYVVDSSWASVIQQAASKGKTIIGYVRTGYLGVSQQKFTTRLGSSDLADWASQIEQDIDKWYELYGGNLGGIFFDEGWPECGTNNIYANVYKRINEYTKRKYPGAYTVLNPGSPIASCFEDTMDTLLTFESSYQTYLNSFVPNDWTPKDPRKIWHIIYKTPQDQIQSVSQLAKQRKAGLIEITDDDNPNPYDNLPSESYMQACMNAISGGTLLRNYPAQMSGSYISGVPSDPRVSSTDYSSVTLTWSAVANALGYAVYKNGALTLELPASLTRATIGMLAPGTSGIQFEVRTLLASGSQGSGRIVTASTTPLPAGGTITDVTNTTQGGNMVYTAKVLVPYAFVRLFVAGPQPNPGIAKGWPIDKNDGKKPATHMVVNYLVEGNDFYSGLYRYSGKWYETSSANADWSWSSINTASQTQSGKTYTWKVPLGGTDAVTGNFVVQGQGYAPLTNVFVGETRMYGQNP